MADLADLQATQDKFYEVVARPEVQGHIAKFMANGGRQRSDLEDNLGERLVVAL